MSANTKSFTVRVNQGIHDKASDKAKELDISLTELVRASVVQFCTQGKDADEPNKKLIEQLENKDKQIDQLHQLLAIQSKTNATLSDELRSSRQLIENLQPKPQKSVWGRISSLFAS